MKALIFTKDGSDITVGIDLRNGNASPFGWSSYEVWIEEFGGEAMLEHKIGDLYCGEPINMVEGYGFRFEERPYE